MPAPTAIVGLGNMSLSVTAGDDLGAGHPSAEVAGSER